MYAWKTQSIFLLSYFEQVVGKRSTMKSRCYEHKFDFVNFSVCKIIMLIMGKLG